MLIISGVESVAEPVLCIAVQLNLLDETNIDDTIVDATITLNSPNDQNNDQTLDSPKVKAKSWRLKP